MIGILVFVALAHVWAYAYGWRPDGPYLALSFVAIVIVGFMAAMSVVGGGDGPPGGAA